MMKKLCFNVLGISFLVMGVVTFGSSCSGVNSVFKAKYAVDYSTTDVNAAGIISPADSVIIDGITFLKEFTEDCSGTESEKLARFQENWVFSQSAVTNTFLSPALDCSQADVAVFNMDALKISELPEDQKAIVEAEGSKIVKFEDDQYVFGGSRIETNKKYKYGYIEARIKFNKDLGGHWFYFYTEGVASDLPEERVGTYEFDIFEYLNTIGSYPSVAHWVQTSSPYESFAKLHNVANFVDEIEEWHTYGVLWTEEIVIYYLDGEPYMSFDQFGKNLTVFDIDEIKDRGFSIISDKSMAIILGSVIANGIDSISSWAGEVNVDKLLTDGNESMTLDYVVRYKTDAMAAWGE